MIDLAKNELTIARAGHYYPLFYRKSKNGLEDIEMKGPALGIKKHADYEQRIFNIDIGDKLLFFTDGIIEQRNQNDEMYSESRLKLAFLTNAQRNEERILRRIESDLLKFTNDYKKDDDITLLLLEFK